MQFTTRAYNSIEFRPETGTLIKRSDNERFRNEIAYYGAVPTHLQQFFPRVLTSGNGYAELEYYDYRDLGKRVLTTTDPKFWHSTFKSIKRILDLFQKESRGLIPTTYLWSMYLDKTENEYHKIAETPEMDHLVEAETLIINGKVYPNFQLIKTDVEDLIRTRLVAIAPAWRITHGDFCLANILASYNSDLDYTSIKLIDPRGSWGEVGIYGDNRYDMAKLYNSLDGGYEYVVSNNYDLEIVGNKIDYRFANTNKDAVFQIMKKELNIGEADDLVYRLIEGLIYMGMIARHYENLSHQQIFYARGIEILNKVLADASC